MPYLYEDFPGVPKEFRFPRRYVNLLNGGEVLSIDPWWFVAEYPETARLFIEVINGAKESEKFLIPFAKIDQDGSGDIACFDGDDFSGNPRVYLSGGDEVSHKHTDWNTRYSFANFDAWIDHVKTC